MKIPNLLLSTMILFFANLLVRILGFFYKIFLTKVVGEYGLGIYHIMFNVLMVIVAFTTTGIPTTLSMLVAKNKALKNNTSILFISTLYVSFLISFLMSLVISFNSSFFSELILHDESLNLFVLAICPAVVILTLSNILRGYFYGLKNVLVPAISIILEQISRILFIVLILSSIKDETTNVYLALVGISVGEIISIFYLVFNLYKDKNIKNRYTLSIYDFLDSSFEVIKLSVPLTFSKISNVLLHSVTSIVIPTRLVLTGISYQQSISIFGVISGMVMPLIYLPFTLSSALVVNLIPNISSEIALKNHKKMKLKINSSILLTFLVGFLFSFCFYFFSSEICEFLFENNTSSIYLKSMFLVPIFFSLNQTLTSILHVLGKEIFCSVVSISSTLIQIFLIHHSVPKIGINGYIYTLTLVSIFLTIVYSLVLYRNLKDYK